MSHPSRQDWLILAALGLIWGASFMGMAIALKGFAPLTLAAGRIALGAVVLTVFAKASGRKMPSVFAPKGMAIWAAAIGMGIFSNALPFFLLGWAQYHVASGFAGVSMAAGPLITLVLAHFFIVGENITLRRFIGIIIGFAGVAVLIGPSALQSRGGDMENIARIVCISAAACYSIGSIVARLCPDVDRRAFSAAVLVSGAMLILPVALWQEGLPTQVPTASAIAAIILLGLIPTALAQILVVTLVRDAGPTFTSLVNYQVPVWSVILGSVFLRETLPPSLFWAMGLILMGVAISQAGALKRLFSSQKKSST
ncbi:DMT family transporter [Aliiroseovarius lamellibrachiae]|uniref:DMT family transporter n=1 Tax=Aliiroseovarius lamellibrachiae TaxID=1924933 RepID=UPI001BE0A8F1|nr:EamA family transporter [Aliiroseovarius lamellibrachiae]MBT2129774.1 EamA family transporter [Aliiroseovarius lamellibrachiae]